MHRNFQEAWTDICRTLLPGTLVRYWNSEQGYTGGAFHIQDVDHDGVTVLFGPAKTERRVSKLEFQRVFASWEDYSRRAIAHGELAKRSGNVSYVVSVLHWYEEAQPSPPYRLNLASFQIAAPTSPTPFIGEQEYATEVLQQATQGRAMCFGPSVEVNFGGGPPVRIMASVGPIAVESGAGTLRSVRGAVIDLICHPNPKKLLLLLSDQVYDSVAAAEQCRQILRRFCDAEAFRVVSLKGHGRNPRLPEDAALVAQALSSFSIDE